MYDSFTPSFILCSTANAHASNGVKLMVGDGIQSNCTTNLWKWSMVIVVEMDFQKKLKDET